MVNAAKIGTATRGICAWLKAGGYKYVAETKPISRLKYSKVSLAIPKCAKYELKLSEYAKSKRVDLENEYTDCFKKIYGREPKSEEINLLLSSTNKIGDSNIIAHLMMNKYELNSISELMKYDNRNILDWCIFWRVSDNGASRLLKVEEFKKLLQDYPEANSKYLNALFHAEIPDNGLVRKLSFDEICKILNNRKITSKFHEVEHSQKDILNIMHNPPECTAPTQLRIGKNGTPRYIYHMTTKSNYEKMLKEGFIKVYDTEVAGDGICTTELSNLFKFWGENKDFGFADLRHELINHIKTPIDSNIVMLRIPTSSLDTGKLILRSQNRTFRATNPNEHYILNEIVQQGVRNNPNKPCNGIASALDDYFTKIIEARKSPHIYQGAPANQANMYNQRKEAVEYIYRDNIPIKNAQNIGELNISEFKRTPQYDDSNPVKSIFTALLKGTPEGKGAEHLL